MLFSGQNHPNKKDIIYLVDLNFKKKNIIVKQKQLEIITNMC